jgi:hypothetical protein
MAAYPRRTFAIGDTVKLRPGTPFTSMAAFGCILEVRDNELKLSLGMHVAWVPRSKVIQP